MKCPSCGAENDSRWRSCQYCGSELPYIKQAPTHITQNYYYGNQRLATPPVMQGQAYAPNQIYNEAYAVCPRCGGKMLPQTVSEMKKRNILTILLWIFLTLCSAGIIPLIAIIRGRKSKTRTYMVCQRCGYRVDSRKLKNWK